MIEVHVVILVSIIILLSKIFSRCNRSKVRVVETVVVIRKVDIVKIIVVVVVVLTVVGLVVIHMYM